MNKAFFLYSEIVKIYIMNRLFFTSDLSKRKINFFFQTLLVLALYYREINEMIPLKLIFWQMIHFSLIAIIDYFLDDHPFTGRKTLLHLLLISIVFLTISLYYGIFDALFIRIHLAILILGNILGGKVDKPFWKLLTILNLLILITIELSRNELQSIFGIALLYATGAIFLLAITERISENNRSFWMVHTIALFLWISYKGPFFEEAFIFLVGGIAYELAKILISKKLSINPL